jgi:hypothetical protein
MLVSACSEFGGEYSLPLPNGYHIERYSSGEVTIVDPESKIVVAGLVREYAVVQTCVVGYVVMPAASPQEQAKYYSHVRPGYFVVDTSTGETSLALSEQEWKVRLTQRNLPIPQLVAPP